MKKSVEKGQFLPTYIGLIKDVPKTFLSKKLKNRLFTFIEKPDYKNSKNWFSNFLSSVPPRACNQCTRVFMHACWRTIFKISKILHVAELPKNKDHVNSRS